MSRLISIGQTAMGQIELLNASSSNDGLPVLQPTKFELVISLKTAKALRLTVENRNLMNGARGVRRF